MFNSFNKLYHPSQYFLFSLVVFIFGIALASWVEINWRKFEISLFALMLGFLLAAIFWRRCIFFRPIGLLGLFLFLALWRFSLSIPIIDKTRIDYYQGQTAQIVAEIKKVDQRIDKQIITAAVKSISMEKKSWDENTVLRKMIVSGQVLLYAGRYPEYSVGDKISFKGLIKKAMPIEDFRYDRFLAKNDIYSLVYYPQIFLIEKAESSYQTVFAEFREYLGNKLDQNLQINEAGIARAMILGDKSKVNQAARDNFSQSGISHIMAISGLHISLLVIILLQVLVFLGLWRRQAFYLISFLLMLYLILIGFPASALRASMMAWLVLWAYHIQRLGESGNLLLLVAALTLLLNPRLLRDDIGWQLSFLAVLGIIYIFPIFENIADKYRISDKWRVRSIVLVTLSVQITTLPIIISSFGILSVYAPIANLLVLPLLPALMISTIIALFLSWLPGALSLIIFLPAQIGLWYFNQVAKIISNLPISYLTIPEIPVIILLSYYLIIILFITWLRLKPPA